MSNRYDQTTSYVPARRDRGQDAQIVEVEPVQMPALPAPHQHTSHEDRARGFGIVTAPLAACTGFVVALIGVVGFGVPVASMAALLAALGGFAAVWALAFIVHTLVSAEGTSFFHAAMMWRYLQREQRQRWRRYESLRDNERGRE